MSKIIQICISTKVGGTIINKEKIEVITDKGIINDRY